MINVRSIRVGYKALFGLLGLSAVVTEIVVIAGRGRFVPENFFSYFTIESNILAGLVFLASAIAVLHGRRSERLDVLRGAATLYMLITGIVFAVLLAGLDVDLTAFPWDNIVLHYIIPVAIIVDWILDPPKKAIGFGQAVWWLVFPLGYLAYSLIRGELVYWYPYPFLNPANNGYAGVAWVALGILVLSLVLTWLLAQVSASGRSQKRGKQNA